jgi:hypothetical protein
MLLRIRRQPACALGESVSLDYRRGVCPLIALWAAVLAGSGGFRWVGVVRLDGRGAFSGIG